MAEGMIHCTYCKNNKCGLTQILKCKHRELMELNHNLENAIQDKIVEIANLENKISKLEKAFEPINRFDTSAQKSSNDQYGVNAILTIQEAKNKYIDTIDD